jgi:hypothetical protein
MTALTPQQKERQKGARARAGQIRLGMRTYIETLGVIALAFREADHLTLGYDSWAEYLDGEFNHERLQLDPAMREKAIEELRLGGLSQRAIATTLGVSRNTVAEHFDQVAPGEPPAPVLGADGKTYSPARSPLVEAMTEAIEDAGQRAQDHRDSSSPGEADGAANTSAAGAGACDPAPAPDRVMPGRAAGPGVGAPDPATPDPGVAAPAEEADIPASSSVSSDSPDPAAGEGEQGGPATSPAGPSCEKCRTDIDDDGYRRCASCDPDGLHTADDDGGCRLCALLASVPDEYLPIQVAEGVHGLQLECGCGAVVAYLKPGMPLAVALVEARLHHGTCQ